MGITRFKGADEIGDPGLNEVIEDNIISWIDWGFLQMGAYFNIQIPTSGAYGGDRHVLRSVDDPRYNNGQVWESYRKNWVWESGLAQSEQPIPISGVFVDNSFLPNSGGYAVNYIDGQIIFDTAIATNSSVEVEYSHKWVNVISSDEVPFFRRGQLNSFRVDDPNFLSGSGVWNELAETRVQLPAVAVEIPAKSYQGYQLGGGQWVRPQVILHILAEDAPTAKRLSSILSEQNEQNIYLFDTYLMQQQNAYPLNYKGDLNSNPLTYPDLIAATGDGGFRYTRRVQNGKMFIFEAREQDVDELNDSVFYTTVRWTTEVILPRI